MISDLADYFPMTPPKVPSRFARFAKWIARTSGRPPAFFLAVAVILAWAITGPMFHYSDTWQLVINTGTTIITFLMVFLIQNTQNRDSEAIHVKLDELIRTIEGAHNVLLDLEEFDEQELMKIRANYAKIALQARSDLEKGKADTGIGKVKIPATRGRRSAQIR
jgi:low affinity Fe/Cu permease